MVREEYKNKYMEDAQLKVSLEALRNYAWDVAWNENVIAFTIVYVRLADRVLYHSMNAWSKFEEILGSCGNFPEDAFLQTWDKGAKYEIEAFLGAAKSLFEKNFMGLNHKDKRNLLGNSFHNHQNEMNLISSKFIEINKLFDENANKIRNHSYHVNSALKDIGLHTHVKKSGVKFQITIPNIYIDEQDKSIDLYDLFYSIHGEIFRLVVEVRDIMLNLYFKQYGRPSNGIFYPLQTKYGNAMVSINQEGFAFSKFHEPSI